MNSINKIFNLVTWFLNICVFRINTISNADCESGIQLFFILTLSPFFVATKNWKVKKKFNLLYLLLKCNAEN